ncbi:ABC transporter permease [Enterococcus sp. AZ196]|uniref:ABC transporter permease n=1 Tax=Enterococcus sp. AZ196 TaxID=2774659 RepID=UPI003D2A9450
MLLKKELRLTLRSLTYWLSVLFIGVFLLTQLGSDFFSLKQPKPNQNDYGIARTTNRKDIQRQTLFKLLQQYSNQSYNTYPLGFLKVVKPSKSDQTAIKKILEHSTGKTINELNQAQSREGNGYSQIDPIIMATKIPVARNYSYPSFEEDMKEVEGLIGKGSDFSKNTYLNQSLKQLTYQEAVKNFRTILTKDRVSGAFARMTCDYLGIILALVPVFVAVTVVLRDKRAKSQLIIYSKSISTFKLYGTRFLATFLLLLLPIILFSLLPAVQSVYIAQKYQHPGDLLLFYQYILGWTIPTIVAIVGISFLLTTVFNGLVSVLFQLCIWLISSMMSGRQIVGKIGLNLIPRFNNIGSHDVFKSIFYELVINRTFWFLVGLLCFMVSCILADLKRKGTMRYGNPN